MIPQELAIVSALIRTAKDVTVTLPMDAPEQAAGYTLFDRPSPHVGSPRESRRPI